MTGFLSRGFSHEATPLERNLSFLVFQVASLLDTSELRIVYRQRSFHITTLKTFHIALIYTQDLNFILLPALLGVFRGAIRHGCSTLLFQAT